MIASGNLSDVDDNDRSRVLIRNISMVSRHRGGGGSQIIVYALSKLSGCQGEL